MATIRTAPKRIKVGDTFFFNNLHWIKRTDTAEYIYTIVNVVGGKNSGSAKSLKVAIENVGFAYAERQRQQAEHDEYLNNPK